jgi:flagellar biosynthetic protein FliR
MEYLNLFLIETDKFLLLLARFAGISLIPPFNTKNVPVQLRAIFTLSLTLFAYIMGLGKNIAVSQNTVAYYVTLLTEILTGIALALVIQFFFAGIQLAGQLLDTQMGFGIMNVVDPMSGTQAPILGNFKYILALLVFLEVDGHHYFIKALFDSYQTIPVGQFSFISPRFIQSYIKLFGDIFVIGCKLSMPIVGTLLVTDFVMGIMSRTVPQMNIFMVGMPAKILIGFAVLLVTVPLYIYMLNSSIGDVIAKIYDLIRV